jgi:hypothetical protein
MSLREWRPRRTCRLCRKPVSVDRLIKYSTRCYAHPHCYSDRHGFDALVKVLSPYRLRELAKFNVKKASERGLIDQIFRAMEDQVDA